MYVWVSNVTQYHVNDNGNTILRSFIEKKISEAAQIPAMTTVPLLVFRTVTDTSEHVCPGVAITSTSLSIIYGSCKYKE